MLFRATFFLLQKNNPRLNVSLGPGAMFRGYARISQLFLGMVKEELRSNKKARSIRVRGRVLHGEHGNLLAGPEWHFPIAPRFCQAAPP